MNKKFVKENPFFYRLWYYFYRKYRGNKIKWFSRNTDLYFDAYPRSGNTFAIFLLRNLWPDLKVVHHFHAIASIKIALSKNIPIFILYRRPADSISSWYLKKLTLAKQKIDIQNMNVDILKQCAADYYNYYNWVLSNSTKINLIKFENLIHKPVQCMALINQSIPLHFQLDNELIDSKVNDLKNNRFGAKDKFGSSLPNNDKDAAKEILADFLKELEIFKKCEIVFNKIDQQLIK